MIRIITVIIKVEEYKEDLYEKIHKGLEKVGIEVIAKDSFPLTQATIKAIAKENKWV